MKIAIDASKTGEKNKTGIEKTVYEIILNLKKIDMINSYYLYTKNSLPPKLLSDNFVEEKINIPILWNKIGLSYALWRDKPDIFLEFSYALPPVSPKNSIVMIHDLAHLKYPEAYSKKEKILLQHNLYMAQKKAKHIIFISKSTQKDFLDNFDYPKAQTSVIPLAYDENLFKTKKASADVLGMDSPYFLYVGRLEKRKNVDGIIKAFAKLKQDKNIKHKLVLVGGEGYGLKEINSTIKALGNLKSEIIMPGYIKDDELADIYGNAEALVFPSCYEGFGIPILEAFASGTPVITSNVSSMPEVAGGAAVLVDPNNIEEICEGMKKIINDQKFRSDLIKKGLDRAKKYSWETTAQNILKIINSFNQ